jgi:ABC-type branched-subunit amino acid transport system substrate-binding protein
MDDAYSPPKTVEATRRLVEQEEVLGMFGSLGTGPQLAVQKYLNAKKVPQLLLNTGSGRWNDPKNFPWTTPGLPMYTTEAHILGKYILETKPNAKIGILAQHDDLGKEYIKALREVLGDKADKMIVAEHSYELTDPTIDSQIVALANSGADVFYNITTGKATSQSIRKVAELGWKPLHLIMSGSTAAEIITAAGADKAIGLTTIKYRKNIGDSQWVDDADVKFYETFRAKYLPNVDPTNDLAFIGYSQGVIMGKVLEACGDELTRANLLKQATTMKNVTAPALLPGLSYSTEQTDYAPLKTLYLATYDGKDWKLSDKTYSE